MKKLSRMIMSIIKEILFVASFWILFLSVIIYLFRNKSKYTIKIIFRVTSKGIFEDFFFSYVYLRVWVSLIFWYFWYIKNCHGQIWLDTPRCKEWNYPNIMRYGLGSGRPLYLYIGDIFSYDTNWVNFQKIQIKWNFLAKSQTKIYTFVVNCKYFEIFVTKLHLIRNLKISRGHKEKCPLCTCIMVHPFPAHNACS